MPNEMGVSTAAHEVAIHIATAMAAYWQPRLRLLRLSDVIQPASARNVQLIETLQSS